MVSGGGNPALGLHTCLLNPPPLFALQLFRINEANQLMQYDQCLAKGVDNTVIITHCNLKEFTEWKYFKVSQRVCVNGKASRTRQKR